MSIKNIIFNCTLEQYNKKYRNRRHRLLKYTKKQVEDFDAQYCNYAFNKNYNLEPSHYLLKDRNWALIGDTYYEIPKPIRFTWFRNLNAGVQALSCLLGAGFLTTSIAVPLYLIFKTDVLFDSDTQNLLEEIHCEIKDGNYVVKVKPKKESDEVSKLEVRKGNTLLIKDNHYIYKEAANELTVLGNKVKNILGNIVIKANVETFYKIDWCTTKFNGEGIKKKTLYDAGWYNGVKKVEFVKDSTKGKLCVGEGGEKKNPIYATLKNNVLRIWSAEKIRFEDNDIPQEEYTGIFCAYENVESFNFDNIDTRKLTDMSYMFSDCTTVKKLDLSKFNTSSVNNMEGMFIAAVNPQTSSFITNLESVDFSSFDTSNVTNMSEMFYGCTKLKSINLSSFNTSNVTNMYEMFAFCDSLTQLDLSSFNTSKVEDFESMFAESVDEGQTPTYHGKLETIYVSEKFIIDKNASSDGMFYGCGKLKGGKGTKYSDEHCDGEYARIDDPDNKKPGYFTKKETIKNLN